MAGGLQLAITGQAHGDCVPAAVLLFSLKSFTNKQFEHSNIHKFAWQR
jgi:hypothetical protein